MAVACTLAATACGDSPTAEQQLQDVLNELHAAYDARDVDRACAVVAARANCPETIRLLLDRPRRPSAAGRDGARDVLAVKSRSRSATALVRLHRHVPGRVAFSRRGDEWKLSSLNVEPVEALSRWNAADRLTDLYDVTRSYGSRRAPCPPIAQIRHSGVEPVSGGCVIRAVSDDTAVLMLNALGDFRIARCSAAYDIHLASNVTSILADRIEFAGPGLCPRIRPCADGETGLRYPWQGSKLVGPFRSPFHMQLDICLNTPQGRARGMFHFRLVDRGGDWTVAAYDYPIGASSIQLSGSFATRTPPGLQLAPKRL